MSIQLDISWIIPGRLAAGGHPTRAGELEPTLAALKTHGIGAIVTAYERPLNTSTVARAGVSYLFLEVWDFQAPTLAQMRDACRFIDEAAERNVATLVHCGAGIGRAATLAAAYLIHSQGLESVDAIARVRALRSADAVQTQSQAKVLAAFSTRQGAAVS